MSACQYSCLLEQLSRAVDEPTKGGQKIFCRLLGIAGHGFAQIQNQRVVTHAAGMATGCRAFEPARRFDAEHAPNCGGFMLERLTVNQSDRSHGASPDTISRVR